MIVTVLRSRVRPEAIDAYNECTEKMRILARAQPGSKHDVLLQREGITQA